jgi:predicted AAA+ superfamily ATPase
MHNTTVARYLDLLEKSFVIINIRGFSRNLRKEVTKTSRYYFYDNGIRNALINNFNPLALRDDVGMLWENYLVMERLKKQSYTGLSANNYFWRTYDQKEIDWVEEREGKLFGYEFTWGKKSDKPPKDWTIYYPHAEFQLITRENFLKFIL